MPPKLYWRVRRFQRALERFAAAPASSLVDVAMAEGYSDQPHFNRDFRQFTGLTPGQYREISPDSSNHVPILPARR